MLIKDLSIKDLLNLFDIIYVLPTNENVPDTVFDILT